MAKPGRNVKQSRILPQGAGGVLTLLTLSRDLDCGPGTKYPPRPAERPAIPKQSAEAIGRGLRRSGWMFAGIAVRSAVGQPRVAVPRPFPARAGTRLPV